MLRELLFTQDAQPFLIAGSGTLGWDQVRVILARGELSYGPHIDLITRLLPTSLSPARTRLSSTAATSAIVSPTGKSDYLCASIVTGFHVCNSLRTYGAKVDEIVAPFGDAVSLSELEAALKQKKYKVVTFTHVDTSTGRYSHVLHLYKVY